MGAMSDAGYGHAVMLCVLIPVHTLCVLCSSVRTHGYVHTLTYLVCMCGER